MSNRFTSPDQQFADSTGAALVGAQLFFYQTGTSTKLNTYSDSGLTIANPNPVVLDASGRAGSIFLQNAAYKVVLAPSTDTDPPTSPIWTQDPVYSSDFSTVAQVQGTSGNPNGQLAGTAGSAGIPASMAWDYVGDVLYVCTQTGTAGTAVWTAVNPNSTAQGVIPPSGRLTLVSGQPVMNSDQIGAAAVLYTPYLGNTTPIYNGSAFTTQAFSELTLALNSNHLSNTAYDVFIINNSGVITLVTGPAWSNSSAGTSTRGTGAGSTQLSRLNGINVNAVAMTGRNGSTTYSVSANQATYLGSILIDGTAGQVSCDFSYGQSRKFGVWNAYNRNKIVLQAGDPTASWNYNSTTIRNSNANSANGLLLFAGLQEETPVLTFDQAITSFSANAEYNPIVGIGYNSNTAFSGFLAQWQLVNSTAVGDGVGTTLHAAYTPPPFLGVQVVTSLEQVKHGASVNIFGTATNMVLQAVWMG